MELALSEIGPRFALKIVRIHAGSFGGPIIYENPNFANPALVWMEEMGMDGDGWRWGE
jgi:hypothetical protein